MNYLHKQQKNSLFFAALLIISLSACEKKSASLFDLEKTNAIATDFTLPTIDNKQLTLSDYKGKLVLLNFWASWCPPCRFEIPDFIKLQSKYQDKGFTFIGIGMEDLKEVKVYSEKIGINYPVTYGYEASRKLSNAYGNFEGALPYSILIGRDQKIIAIYPGLLTPSRLSKAIEKHL
ncbi:MAG TPA: TlpA family protein disulfide reductase [Leucothrix mucor]|nr:TlpA family protein disulfide reductase [Leucothrix mucor]